MSAQKLVQSLTASTLATNTLQVGGSFVLKGISIVSPKPGTVVKVGLAAPGVIIAPSGSLTEATLIFPSRPVDGQIMYISFTQDVGKLTFTNGKFANTSLLGPSAKAGDNITLYFDEKTGKWYKLAGNTHTTPSPSLAKASVPKEESETTA